MNKNKVVQFTLNPEQNYFPALTGIRALAAFMVYCHHFNPFPVGTFFFGIVNELHIGVNIFFVLSGFLICYRYFENFEFTRSGFRTYLLNRLARIYPIYFLLTTFTFVILFFAEGPSGQLVIKYLLNITFLKGFFEYFKFSGIPQSWSLTVEVCFYAVAPAFFLLYKSGKKYLYLIPPVFLVFGLLLVVFFSKFDFYGLFSNFGFMFLYTFFGRCTEFIAGALLAQFLMSGKSWRFKSIPNFFTISGTVLILITLIGMRYLRVEYSFSIPHLLGILINNFILPVFILALLFGLVTEKSFLRKLLETPLLNILGKSSYIFYLIHLGTIQVYLNRWIGTDFILSFLVFNLISIAIYFLVEQPVNRQIRAFSRKQRHFPV